ncbi:glycosyltransferase family 2 protein [Nocardioides sp. KIGAM211]|uniref:Glycosyltransferase family 2 protein n=1 Tax=Nocardioides luti TaxID=2761101 RepID=A0A7X0RJ11_9ACTN|nr:glycosyltransferase family 2 protein [Nocardioides luti]MBB6629035.1 glycosyltransferase family 2 protein [Nocardioides luti]
MLLTASTIRDSLPNVRRFVAANLASGVDHMVVFLDAPKDPGQAEVRAELDAHPHVTAVPTGRAGWWRDDRPAGLNVRQRINANVVLDAVRDLAWAEWVVHVDGDEVARVDPDLLAAVPADTGALRLDPLEAVSQWHVDAPPTLFKRLLDQQDLHLLFTLGVITEPSNTVYFHGHVKGKAGVRPGSGLRLTLHNAVDDEGRIAEGHRAPGLAVLHYDSISGEEFARKWAALSSAGKAQFRPNRGITADALAALVGKDLPDEVRETYLRRIYERTTRDDVETLRDLGLLETVDPLHAARTPRALPAGALQELESRLAAVRDQPKRPFHAVEQGAGGEGGGGGKVARLRDRLPGSRRP